MIRIAIKPVNAGANTNIANSATRNAKIVTKNARKAAMPLPSNSQCRNLTSSPLCV
jgi:hypothetical protein